MRLRACLRLRTSIGVWPLYSMSLCVCVCVCSSTVHVSDIHNTLSRVDQLKSWLTKYNQRVDVVLMSGDIADGPMDLNLSEEETKKHQTDLDNIVESFMQVKNCVYYIPGNVRECVWWGRGRSGCACVFMCSNGSRYVIEYNCSAQHLHSCVQRTHLVLAGIQICMHIIIIALSMYNIV